jgi:hypothetical protein
MGVETRRNRSRDFNRCPSFFSWVGHAGDFPSGVSGAIADQQFGYNPNSEYKRWVRNLYRLGLILRIPSEWEATRTKNQIHPAHRRSSGIAARIRRLQRPRVVAPVGQRVAAGVPEHVRVWLEAELRLDPGSLNHPRKSGGDERRTTL